MRRAHLVAGLVFVAVFVASGLFMLLRFPAAYEGDRTMRMLYRSAHIYVLLSALMNIVAGIHMRVPAGRLQRVGSILLLVAPMFFTLAFSLEPAPARVDRPYATLGAVSAAVGTLLHLLGR